MFRWTVHLKGGPNRDKDHAAVALGHNVYSFGGYCDGETYENHRDQIEVHVFNTVSLHWTTLPPVTTERGERPLHVPSMRHGHTAVLIDGVIYIWGGVPYCSALYALDVDTHRWFKPKIYQTVPRARYKHTACVLGKVMFIYGGFNWTGCTNDIYKLDTTTMVWSLIDTRGTLAPVSSCHSATIIGTKMFVFGGLGDQLYNSIRVFDTETDCWLRTPAVSRKYHSAFAYNGELYIFGGCDKDWVFNDLWKFNPLTFTWTKVEPKGKALCSWMTGMCCCMVGDCIILFGGYKGSTYILDLSPSLKTLCKLTVIKYKLERSELPHNIRWELAAMRPHAVKKRKGRIIIRKLAYWRRAHTIFQ